MIAAEVHAVVGNDGKRYRLCHFSLLNFILFLHATPCLDCYTEHSDFERIGFDIVNIGRVVIRRSFCESANTWVAANESN